MNAHLEALAAVALTMVWGIVMWETGGALARGARALWARRGVMTGKALPLPLHAVSLSEIDEEPELLMSDGRVFRRVNFSWFLFPDGTPPTPHELWQLIHDEYDRLRLLNKWSETGGERHWLERAKTKRLEGHTGNAYETHPQGDPITKETK